MKKYIIISLLIFCGATSLVAQKQTNDATYNAYLANIEAANTALKNGNGKEAKRQLNNAPEKYRGWEWNYLNHALKGYILSESLPFVANDMAMSASGKSIAVAGADGAIHFYDNESLTQTAALTVSTQPVFSAAYFNNDTKLVACDKAYKLKVWDIQNKILLWEQPTQATADMHIAVSPDATQIALGSWYQNKDTTIGFIQLFDAFRGQVAWETTFIQKPITAISFSHDGKLLSAATMDGSVMIWDVADKKLKYQFSFDEPIGDAAINDLVFSADDSYLMATSNNTMVKVWNMYTGTTQFDLIGHNNAAHAGAFSNDGTFMFTGSADGSLFVWSAESGQVLNKLFGHEGAIQKMLVAKDGTYLYTLSADKTIKKWSMTHAAPFGNPAGLNGATFAFALSPDNNVLIAQGSNGILTVWNTNNGKIVKQFPTFGGIMNAASVSPDNKNVVGCNWDGRIKVWDIATGKKVIEFAGLNAGAVNCRFSPDGQTIAVAGYDSTISVWEFSSGALLQVLKHNGLVYHTNYSNNQQLLVGATTNGEITIWNTTTYNKIITIKLLDTSIFQCTFSPDNKYLAAVGDDKIVYIVDVESGKIVQKLNGHTERIYTVAWSPDGKRLATGSSDNSVRVWDTATWQTTIILTDFAADIYTVLFSNDSKSLYVNCPQIGFKKYSTE